MRNFGFSHPKPIYRPSIASYAIAAALWLLAVTILGHVLGWI